MLEGIAPQSVLFVTLDSCRFDAFDAAAAPNLKAIGPLHRAQAPANFTFASHAAFFVGFTPGIPAQAEPYVNSKFAKIFKLEVGGSRGFAEPAFSLTGSTIIEGFRRKGYFALGSGSVDWFDPKTEASQTLTRDFEAFHFAGRSGLASQIAWAVPQIEAQADKPVFLFLNIGETHVPYWYIGAPWDVTYNPCRPFGENNDAEESRRRQIACVEHVDGLLAPLLHAFRDATIVVCADHGDCWGEDGLWEHGITHPKVMEVPLLFRLGARA